MNSFWGKLLVRLEVDEEEKHERSVDDHIGSCYPLMKNFPCGLVPRCGVFSMCFNQFMCDLCTVIQRPHVLETECGPSVVVFVVSETRAS